MLSMPRQRTDRAGERIRACVEARVQERHVRLSRAASLLARHSPQAEFARRAGQVEALAGRLTRLAPQLAKAQRDGLANASARFRVALNNRLSNIGDRLQSQRLRVSDFERRMQNAILACQEKRQAHVRSLLQLYNSLNYTSVLARGFAIVRDGADRPLSQAAAVAPGAALQIQFADGRIGARAEGSVTPPETEAVARSANPLRPPKPGSQGQGSLF
jgi:exodeoxyribonuclease VII large subunit